MDFKAVGGKKFLIAIICAFCLANAVSVLWFISRPAPQENFKVEYPLIDFSRNFVSQEHYLSTLQPLRSDLEELVKREGERGNSISLYLEYFNTGANISINNDMRLLGVSLIKVPIALAAMKKIENGDWKLDDKFEFLAEDIQKQYGDLYLNPVGSRFTVEFLIKTSLQKSDNTAYNILLRNLGIPEIDKLLEYLGLDDLFNNTGKISSKEYSRFFRSLYAANYLSRENSEKLLEWLSQTSFNDFLSLGLPDGIIFSHKFGEHTTDRVFLDSGIVYVPNRPYLITVFIKRSAEKSTADEDMAEAKRIMKEISSKSFKYVSEY